MPRRTLSHSQGGLEAAVEVCAIIDQDSTRHEHSLFLLKDLHKIDFTAILIQ